MQIAAQNNLTVHQMDVKTPYLHAPIEEEIFMDQPEGFEQTDSEQTLVYKLKTSLYELKQSGRNWYKLLNDYLEQNGFVRNSSDHCVYRKCVKKETVLVIIWVDDLIIAASNLELVNTFKDTMKTKFNMKDLGKISYFLGIHFEQKESELRMNQKTYIERILERFGMSECRPRSTPCEIKIDTSICEQYDKHEPVNPREYREIVGSLIYAMTCTRPDISWVVSKLSQTLAQPKREDLVTAKHVLRYLKNTNDYEYDSDWASSVEDRRSTTGYCFSLTKQGPVISWKTKKQQTVALSTCEAEYIVLTATTQESMYLTQLLNGMDNKMYTCTTIFGDNQGAIALTKNPVNRQRSKHIDVKYHYIREGKINIIYCPSENMTADILTKPVPKAKIVKFQKWFFGH